MEIVARKVKAFLFVIVRRTCLPSTISHSDQWAVYKDITSFGFQHYTVNHFLNFVNSERGVHMQHIESYGIRIKFILKK